MPTAHTLQLHAHCICVIAIGTREGKMNFRDKKNWDELLKGSVLTGQG